MKEGETECPACTRARHENWKPWVKKGGGLVAMLAIAIVTRKPPPKV